GSWRQRRHRRYAGTQWVGHDDPRSIKRSVDFACLERLTVRQCRASRDRRLRDRSNEHAVASIGAVRQRGADDAGIRALTGEQLNRKGIQGGEASVRRRVPDEVVSCGHALTTGCEWGRWHRLRHVEPRSARAMLVGCNHKMRAAQWIVEHAWRVIRRIRLHRQAGPRLDETWWRSTNANGEIEPHRTECCCEGIERAWIA